MHSTKDGSPASTNGGDGRVARKGVGEKEASHDGLATEGGDDTAAQPGHETDGTTITPTTGVATMAIAESRVVE